MKRILLALLFVIAVVSQINAQAPANGSCATAQFITIPASGSVCITSTNLNAATGTSSNACVATPGHKVWFTYIATGPNNTVTATPTGSTSNLAVTMLSSSCTAGTYDVCNLAAGSAAATTSTGYTIGKQVWVSVESVGGTDGSFQLCITSVSAPPALGEDCSTAANTCTKEDLSYASYAGYTSSGFQPPCFTSAVKKDVWIKFTVGSSGTLEFTGTPLGASEFDWAIYDITSGCPTNSTTPQACNYNYDNAAGDPFGMSTTAPAGTCNKSTAGGAANEFCQPMNVVAGKTYALLIDNYSNKNIGFDLTWGGTFQMAPVAGFTASPTTACGVPLVSTISNTSSGPAGTTYSWNFGDGATSSSSAPGSHTYSAAGNYILSLVASANGCSSTASSPINVSVPYISVSPVTNKICPGGSVALTGAASPFPLNFDQSFTNTTNYAVANFSNANSVITTSGIPAGAVLTSICVNITHGNNTDITLKATAPNGTNTILSANKGGTGNDYNGVCFVPSGGATLPTTNTGLSGNYNSQQPFTNFTGAFNGNWTLNMADGAGGSSGTLLNWTINFNATNTITGYTWSPGGYTSGAGSTSTDNVSPASSTTYTVVATDTKGCTSSANATVRVKAPAAPTSSGTTICQGASATLTASPTNTSGPLATGTAATYAWYAASSGGSALSNVATFTTPTLAATTTYYVETADSGCTSTSRTPVVVTVNPTLVPSISISPSANPVCVGTSVTFTASATNGGTPVYQWKLNGSNTGGNSSTYSSTFNNGDVVSCVLTSNATCASPLTATSPSITLTINPTYTPSVSISPSANPVCAGTSVTYTATPVNGGAGPSYQWKVNGSNVGSNSTTYSATFNNGDVISCVMTSNAACVTSATATATSTMTVTPLVTPSISVSPSANPICAGASVTFTASISNGGASPSYQWKVNGANVGGNSNSYTAVFNNGDVVTCVLTSNANCASPTTATAANVTMVVNPILVPAVSISPSANPICAGTSATFTASPTNGGAGPAYQWKVNGSNVGGNSSTYSSTFNNGDVVTCILTSNATCASPLTATSPGVTMTVNPVLTPSLTISPSANPICAGTSVTFNPSPTNGGAGPVYQWKLNGSNVATGSSYTAVFNNGDVISCVLTSNAVCVSPSTATAAGVTMTVNPIPTASASPSFVTICSGQTASSTLSGPVAGTTFSWTVSGAGVSGASGGSGSSISQTLSNSGAVTSSATYTITPTANTCVGAAIKFVAAVNPLPVLSVNPSASTICSGQTSAINCTSNIAGTTYSWTAGLTGAAGASAGTGNAINQTLTTTGPTAGTVTYTVVPSASTCPGTSSIAIVTVSPLPSVTATPSYQTICSGNTTSISLSSDVSGATFSWTASMPANVSGASNGSGSSITQTLSNTGVLPADVTYTITGSANTCSGSPVKVIITVNPAISLSVTPASQTICSGQTANVAISGTPAGITFSWAAVAGSVSGASSSTGNAIADVLTNSGSTAATVTYTVVPSAFGCNGTSAIALVTVTPLPVAPTVTPTYTYCENAAATPLSATGTNLLWYSTANGGVGSGTTPTPNTSVSGVTTYYVSQTVNGCEGPRQNIIVTVNPTPLPPTAASVPAYCAGDVVAPLTAAGNGGTLQWFSDAGLTSLAGTGSPFNSGATTSSSFWVNELSLGCPGPAVKVDILVNPLDDPSFSYPSSTVCITGANPVPTVTGRPGGIFTGPAAVTINAATGEIDLSSTPAGGPYTITYTTNGPCPQSATFNVTISLLPNASFTFNGPYCIGGNDPLPSFGAGSSSGTFIGAPIGINMDSGTGEINLSTSAPGTYSITNTIAAAAGCPPSINVQIVTILPVPAVTVTPVMSDICNNGTTAITISQSTPGTPSWTLGSVSSGITGASAGTGFTIAQTLTNNDTLPGTVVYQVLPSSNGCIGNPVDATVTVAPTPALPKVSSPVKYCQGDATAILSATGTGLLWYTTAAGGSGSATAPTPSSAVAGSTTYYVSQTINGCEGPRAGIEVIIKPKPLAPVVTGNTSFCEDASITSVSASGSGGTFTWFNDPGLAANTQVGSGVSFTPSISLPATYDYYVMESLAGCPGPDTHFQYIIIPKDSAGFNYPSATLCVSGSDVSPVITGALGGTFSAVPAGLSIDANTGTISPGSSTPGTYHVTYTTAGACPSNSSIDINVTTGFDASFSFAGPYCQSEVNPSPTYTTGSAGLYSATPAGLVFVNANTGEINLSMSLPGIYTITNTIAASGGCALDSKTAVVEIKLSPAKPAVSPAVYCQNDVATALVATGTNLLWYTSATGGVGDPSTPTTSTAIAGTTSYYVSQALTGCESIRNVLTVTVKPRPLAPLVSNPAPLCLGNIIPSLSAHGTGGLFTWYSGAGLTPSDSVFADSTYTPVLSASGTFSFWVTESLAGCIGPSQQVDVVINPLDNPAFSYGSGTYCKGGTNPSPVITGLAGGVFSANSAALIISPSTGVIDIIASATGSYSITYLTNGPCPQTAVVQINIVDKADATFSYAGPYCFSNSAASPVFGPGASAGTFTATPAGLSFLNANTGLVDLALSAANTYTVTNTITGGGCLPESAQNTIVILPSPTAPGVTSPLDLCEGQPAVALSAAGGNLKWYATALGGIGAATAPQALTITAPLTTSYYVSQTIDGCEGPRSEIVVNIKSLPAAPGVSPVSYCKNDVAAPLNAIGSNLLWYMQPAGGIGSGLSSTPNTAVAGTASYYVSQNVNGCEGPRALLPVVVNFTVPPAVNTPVDLCQNANPTPLTANGTNLLWYTSSTGGIGSSTAPAIATSLKGSYTYYVSQSGNNCESARAAIVVNINAPSAPVVSPLSLCYMASTQPLNAQGSNLLWYSVPVGGMGNTIAPTPIDTVPGSFSYYVSQTVGGCEGPRAVINVTVNRTPQPVTADIVYCQNETAAALTAQATGNDVIKWYTKSGIALAAAPVPNTQNVTVLTYLASEVDGNTGCESTPGVPLNIVVHSTPALPVVADKVICPGTSARFSYPGAGAVNWFDDANTILLTDTGFVTPSLTATTTYLVEEVSIDNCPSGKTTFQVIVAPEPVAPAINGVTICKGESAHLSVINPGIYTYEWYNAADSLLAVDSSYTTSALQSNTTYHVYAWVGICKSPTSASGVVTVNTHPATPSVMPVKGVCAGSDALVSANSFPGAIFMWYDVPSGGTGIIGDTYTVTNLQNSGLVIDSSYVWVDMTVNGCTSLNRAKAAIPVYPIPPVPSASSPDSICKNALYPTLSGKGSIKGGVLQWCTDSSFVSVTTGNTFKPAGSLSSSTFVYVLESANGCKGNFLAIPVNAIPSPEVSFAPGKNAGCSPFTGHFSINKEGYICKWKFMGEDTIVSQNSVSHLFNYNKGQQEPFSVKVYDKNGCFTELTEKATAYEQPEAAFTYDPPVPSNLDPTIYLYSNSTGHPTLFKWEFGDGDSTTGGKETRHTYQKSGNYIVTLWVSTAQGCSSVVKQGVNVIEDFAIFIPDAFTPNGDNLNDTFSAKGMGIVAFDMLIFNRWGNEVFHTNNMANGWDGTGFDTNAIAQNDVYVYKIVATDAQHVNHQYVGKVTLLK